MLNSVQNFREPQSAEEVRSFLGLVTYVGKFIPNLATVTEELRILLKKDQPFIWEEAKRTAFRSLKEALMGDLVLGFFDVKDKTQIVADASPVGLGAVLLQIGVRGPRAIYYASKSLCVWEILRPYYKP